MIAGPSEILVVADDTSNPDWVAMDLFSQPSTMSKRSLFWYLVLNMTEQVLASMQRLLPTLERSDIIEASLTNRAVIVDVADHVRLASD